MNEEFTAIRPDPALWNNVVPFSGDVCFGNIHRTIKAHRSGVTGKIAKRDQVFDMAQAIGNSAEEISGRATHQATLQADRHAYGLKDGF